jgi:transcriptional regulator with XRE-family HTH domain
MAMQAEKCVSRNETIGMRLRDAIANANLSLRSFADASGLPYRSVQSYVSDQQKPGSEALIKIQNSLSISIDWLLLGNQKLQFSRQGPVKRRPVLHDMLEVVDWLGTFEGDPEHLAMQIATHIRIGRQGTATLNRFLKMVERMRLEQEKGGLAGFVFDDMSVEEMLTLYVKEFGEPDF